MATDRATTAAASAVRFPRNRRTALRRTWNPDPAGGVMEDPKILDEAAEEEPQS